MEGYIPKVFGASLVPMQYRSTSEATGYPRNDCASMAENILMLIASKDVSRSRTLKCHWCSGQVS